MVYCACGCVEECIFQKFLMLNFKQNAAQAGGYCGGGNEGERALKGLSDVMKKWYERELTEQNGKTENAFKLYHP